MDSLSLSSEGELAVLIICFSPEDKEQAMDRQMKPCADRQRRRPNGKTDTVQHS